MKLNSPDERLVDGFMSPAVTWILRALIVCSQIYNLNNIQFIIVRVNCYISRCAISNFGFK